MSTPKISVIVPVYNSEIYLRRCIESILSQTFGDFELLLIDDGSTDLSREICDDYFRSDNRIKVFHKLNEGISLTRQFGLDHAYGDYIQFVDSDDWIEQNMLELMYNQAVQESLDIVGCNFWEVNKDGKKEIKTYYTTKEHFLRDIISGYWGVVWKILVKKDLYKKNKICFQEKINGGEDYVVCVKLLTMADSVRCVDKPLYYYNRINPTSIISTPTKSKIYEQIRATELIEQFLKDKNIISDYTRELDIRKFRSKFPLLRSNHIEWYSVFPESNYVYKYLKLGLRNKLYMIVANVDAKIKSRIKW